MGATNLYTDVHTFALKTLREDSLDGPEICVGAEARCQVSSTCGMAFC